jgi:hypothetical protein
MRSLSSQELAVLASTAGRASHVRVKVKDGSGTWRDVTSLEGRDFLDAVEIDESVDQPVSAATVTLKRQIDLFSVAPLRADSKLNTLGGQLVTPGREFSVEAAVRPVGMTAGASDWRVIFQGDIDEVDFADEQLVFRGRDLGGRLQDAFIEVERNYGDDANGVDVEVVMQSILTDNGTGVQLYFPASPGWKLRAFTQKKASVLDALRDLAQQIGWEVRYIWREAAGAFALTFREPQRTNPSLAWTFGANDYRNVTKLAINRTDVRNKIEVVYSDAADLDFTGQPKRKSVVVQDAASQAQYRLRFMQIAEGASSNIDREIEALKMANAALSDLKDPLAEQEVELDFFLPVMLGDLYRFTANGVHYSAHQNLAVIAYRHTFTAEGDALTTITTRGQPSFGVSMWLEMDVRPGQSEPRHTAPPLDPLSVVVTPIVNGVAVKLTPAASGPEATSFELHVSTTSGFTPSSSTLRGSFDTTSFDVADLIPGTTYYVRVVPRDSYGNRGNASSQQAVIPKKLEGGSLADSAVGWQHLLYPPSDNLIPNGYNEAGVAALGKHPDGAFLVEDPTNAREGRWVRRLQMPADGLNTEINWVGNWGGLGPGGRIKCAAGDQFFAEVYVKGSSAFVGSSGTLYLLWEDANGNYSGQNSGQPLPTITTSYQRVTIKGTCPPGCAGVQLFWQIISNASNAGKLVYFDAVSMRKMVTFDLIAANTLKTSNYDEDGSGIPTAGVKLDNVGDALKVASNHVRVGRYYLSDAFFRSVQALADTGQRVFYRGNNNPSVNSGAPNIDRVNIQVAEGYAINGASGLAGSFSWAHYKAFIQPQSADDNLDGLRYLYVAFHYANSLADFAPFLYDILVPVCDRKYQNGSDSNADNLTATNFLFVYGDTFNRLSDSMNSRKLYLKVRLHGVYGYSAERWFYPPASYGVNMTRSASGPGGAPSGGGGGGGGSDPSGNCVAPWEPVMLDDGTELPADLLRPGMRVLTMLEHGDEGGAYELLHVSRHQAARFKLVTDDGRVIVVTPNHRWRTRARGWVRTDELCRGEVLDGFAAARVSRVEPLDFGEVVKITVNVAKTYVVKGLLAHNMKPRE